MILDRLADATRARYAQRMTDTPLDIVKRPCPGAAQRELCL